MNFNTNHLGRMSQIIRCIALLLLMLFFPFVRSCDDAQGLVTTSGFPLPFASHIDFNYSFANLNFTALQIDAIVLLAALVVLYRFMPITLSRITDLRVISVITAYAVFCFIANPMIFVMLFFAGIAIR
jgi:hypothetical protein